MAVDRSITRSIEYVPESSINDPSQPQADLKRLGEHFPAAVGTKAKAASGPGATSSSSKAAGRLVSLSKLREFAFAIPHVGWKAELARFRAAKEAAALAKSRSPKAPPQSPPAEGARARRPPPSQPARQPPATVTTARATLLRRRSSANSTTTSTTTSTCKGPTPSSGPSSHAKSTTASTLRAQLQRANSASSSLSTVARAGPVVPRRKSDAGPTLRRQPSKAGSSNPSPPCSILPPPQQLQRQSLEPPSK